MEDFNLEKFFILFLGLRHLWVRVILPVLIKPKFYVDKVIYT